MITSPSNATLRRFRKLASHLPDGSSRVIIEGVRLFQEAVQSKTAVEALFVTSRVLARPEALFLIESVKSVVPAHGIVSEGAMKSLSLEETPPGLWALIKIPENREAMTQGRVVVLAGVRDPGNAGTLIRTSEAAGANVWFSEDSIHRYHPKVVKAAMGSAFRVSVKQGPVPAFLRKLKEAGWSVVGTAARGGVRYDEWDWRTPFALLLGSEACGLPEELARLADVQVSIPLQGKAESLNVAVAGAVLLFEAVRQG